VPDQPEARAGEGCGECEEDSGFVPLERPIVVGWLIGDALVQVEAGEAGDRLADCGASALARDGARVASCRRSAGAWATGTR
jgi:hypothetical protein